jgi:hypothetical protein
MMAEKISISLKFGELEFKMDHTEESLQTSKPQTKTKDKECAPGASPIPAGD